MRLNNLSFPGGEGRKDLRIGDGKITAILPSSQGSGPSSESRQLTGNRLHPEPCLSFEDALVFPGLINSHDHLDFNLFPSLGNKIYKNYTAWGQDIHTHNKEAIAAVLKIPRQLRTLWGLYKNLLNGFTTVVNHGEKLETDGNIITVFQDYHCLHSVGFEKSWRWKLNRPGRSEWPFELPPPALFKANRMQAMIILEDGN